MNITPLLPNLMFLWETKRRNDRSLLMSRWFVRESMLINVRMIIGMWNILRKMNLIPEDINQDAYIIILPHVIVDFLPVIS